MRERIRRKGKKSEMIESKRPRGWGDNKGTDWSHTLPPKGLTSEAIMTKALNIFIRHNKRLLSYYDDYNQVH
jgi:hypothetical protein